MTLYYQSEIAQTLLLHRLCSKIQSLGTSEVGPKSLVTKLWYGMLTLQVQIAVLAETSYLTRAELAQVLKMHGFRLEGEGKSRATGPCLLRSLMNLRVEPRAQWL